MSLEGNSNLIQTNWQSPPKNPMNLLKDWVAQAQNFDVSEPLGITLTTIDRSGWLRSRVVLAKELGESSIIFGTSSLSEKGKDIEHNPKVAVNFWWRESVQQIHCKGFAYIASKKKSDRLFENRSRDAKAVALSSKQSQPLKSELDLKTKFAALNNCDRSLQRPPTWNAYKIIPTEYEFWQGDATRLHKRLRYRLEIPQIDFAFVQNIDESKIATGTWIQQRLQP